jgi:hypothetical protein
VTPEIGLGCGCSRRSPDLDDPPGLGVILQNDRSGAGVDPPPAPCAPPARPASGGRRSRGRMTVTPLGRREGGGGPDRRSCSSIPGGASTLAM